MEANIAFTKLTTLLICTDLCLNVLGPDKVLEASSENTLVELPIPKMAREALSEFATRSCLSKTQIETLFLTQILILGAKAYIENAREELLKTAGGKLT